MTADSGYTYMAGGVDIYSHYDATANFGFACSGRLRYVRRYIQTVVAGVTVVPPYHYLDFRPTINAVS